MLLALARDPILRLTAEPILEMELGERFDKTEIQEVIAAETGDRFSETSIKKISRMTGSSWTQSGHLEGRYKKIRQRPDCTPENTAYALLLGYMNGVRGTLLFWRGRIARFGSILQHHNGREGNVRLINETSEPELIGPSPQLITKLSM